MKILTDRNANHDRIQTQTHHILPNPKIFASPKNSPTQKSTPTQKILPTQEFLPYLKKIVFLGQPNENEFEKKFHFKIRDEKMPTESYLNHATLR